MDIRLSAEMMGSLVVMHTFKGTDKVRPLTEYKPEEVRAMRDTCASVTIYLKDESRADKAKALVRKQFPHFKGKLQSKATEYGWFVGQTLKPSKEERRDEDAFDALDELQAT